MDNPISITKDSSGRVYLNPDLAALLGNAAMAAYSDFTNPGANPSPLSFTHGSTFNFLQRFTGFDDVAWGSGKEERYGLVYQWSAQKDIYLIAFRGTSSPYDMVLDLESGITRAFVPYANASGFPTNVHVGDGFDKIYSTKNQAMSASMQQQLFEIISELKPAPRQLIITGHSLGSALASLFTLDVAVSLTNTAVVNINFASPRVGAAMWQQTYNQTYRLENNTVEIRNAYDLVPKVPPASWPFDFKDVGLLFPVSFGLKNYHINFPEIVIAWHSLANYQYVINRATLNSPQVWTGNFEDQAHAGWGMVSYDPYSHVSDIMQSQDRKTLEQLVSQRVGKD